MALLPHFLPAASPFQPPQPTALLASLLRRWHLYRGSSTNLCARFASTFSRLYSMGAYL
jgi:hypothetical protein